MQPGFQNEVDRNAMYYGIQTGMSTLKMVCIREDLPEPFYDWHRFDLNLAEHYMDERYLSHHENPKSMDV
jgi:hypothetical protein